MPGRSRQPGAWRIRKCQNCRERKVKCDGREPRCGTCERARLSCRGFSNSPLPFIPFEPKYPGRKRLTANEDSSASHRSESGKAVILRNQRIEPSIPPHLNVSSAIFRDFFLLRLTGNECSQPMSNLLCEFVYANGCAILPQQKCIKALTAGYYSRRIVDHHAKTESMVAYQGALEGVRKSLAGQPPQLETDLIMSLMCLSLYENIAVTNPRSWNNLYGIISCLLWRRGPQFYQTEKNRSLLLAFRYAIIVSAGVERKHCFLAQRHWKEVIKPVGDEKSYRFDNLLNIAVDIPGLLHDLDDLKDGRMCDHTARAGWAHRVMGVLLALKNWREYLPPLLTEDGFPQTISIQTASALAFHHMLLLLIEELCHLLEVPWLTPTSLSTNVTFGMLMASIAPGRLERKHWLASDILRLAQQSIGKDTPIYGVLTFMMPLHVAYDNLIKDSPEMEDIAQLMGGVVAQQHGFNIALQHGGMYKAFEDTSTSL